MLRMMPEPLPDWPRSNLAEGGFEPLVYYRVYGEPDPGKPLSSSRYRCGGIPNGIDLSLLDRARHARPLDEILANPMGDVLRAKFPRLDALVAASSRCVNLLGSPSEHATLNYFRDTIGLVTWLLDNGGTFVYDPLQLKCWSREEWMRDVFEPASPRPLAHCVILVSAEESEPSRRWYHTRGLRKFGRPDVSVHDVPETHRAAVVDLCERLILFQADGGVIADGSPVRMKSLPDGGTMYARGDFDDPDFNNVHLDVRFPQWTRER